MALEEACERLRTGKGSIRCSEVIAILESLGFIVDATRRGKHHVYTHPAIKGFGSNFACPHKAGDPVKNNYITGILSVLRVHEEALLKHLGDGQ